jgi:hypothetical protein
MKAWETFYPDVLPYITDGTPMPMVDRHLMRAAQYFCDTTRAWQMDLDPIMLAAGLKVYDMELEPGTEMVRLESATLDGDDISVWRAGSNPGNHGRYVFAPNGRTVGISWTPSGPMSLVLTVSARPSDTATGLDDVLSARHSKVIADGAVASLNKSVGDRTRFEADCATIAVRVWRGNAAIRPRSRAMFL